MFSPPVNAQYPFKRTGNLMLRVAAFVAAHLTKDQSEQTAHCDELFRLTMAMAEDIP